MVVMQNSGLPGVDLGEGNASWVQEADLEQIDRFQAQLGTDNVGGRGEVMQNSCLPWSSPNFGWLLGHLPILNENWPTLMIQGMFITGA